MTAPPEQTTNGMLALPTEVQQHIIDEAENIKSTRQVCRELAAASDRAFLEEYFVDRSHLLTECGLRGLRDISADARLRSKMANLELVVPELDSYQFPRTGLLEDSHRWQIWHRGEVKKGVKTLSKLCKDILELKQRVAAWRRWDEIMVPFRHNDPCLRLLTDALLHLARAGVTVTIVLASEVCGRPFGLLQLEKQLGTSAVTTRTFGQCRDYSSAGNMVLRAIAQARFPLTALELEGDEWGAVVNYSMFAIPTSSAKDAQLAFSSLKTLSLGFGEYDPRDGHREVFAPDDFKFWMAGATSLEKVKFVFTRSGDDFCGILASVLQGFGASPLREVTISGGVGCKTEELQSFLVHHKTTLRFLSLSWVTLKEDYAWNNLLLELATSFKLTHFDADTLGHAAMRRTRVSIMLSFTALLNTLRPG